MSDFPHLKNAPIVEGLIDFRLRSRKELDATALASIHAKIRDRYPLIKPIQQVTAFLEVKGQEAAHQSLSRRESGHRFESADGKHVFQAQLEGFTFSRLKPYLAWEALIDEARALWALYRDVAKPEAILRVATRFINRVDIPLPVGKIDEYFAAPPTVPKGLPESVSEFFSRMVITDPDTGAVLILTQALDPANTGGNTLSFIVDVDVFKDSIFDVRSEDCWELLAQLRNLKNRAFFASLTPKTVELFK